MDYDPTRWPWSPRIMLRCTPLVSNGPKHIGLCALRTALRTQETMQPGGHRRACKLKSTKETMVEIVLPLRSADFCSVRLLPGGEDEERGRRAAQPHARTGENPGHDRAVALLEDSRDPDPTSAGMPPLYTGLIQA